MNVLFDRDTGSSTISTRCGGWPRMNRYVPTCNITNIRSRTIIKTEKSILPTSSTIACIVLMSVVLGLTGKLGWECHSPK